MIDDPEKTADLIARMQAALPVPATVAPVLAATLRRRRPPLALPRVCEVVAVFDMGDEGGIVCDLAGEGIERQTTPILTSITHLDFGYRHPLSKEIRAYQEHRVKKLRRRDRRMAL